MTRQDYLLSAIDWRIGALVLPLAALGHLGCSSPAAPVVVPTLDATSEMNPGSGETPATDATVDPVGSGQVDSAPTDSGPPAPDPTDASTDTTAPNLDAIKNEYSTWHPKTNEGIAVSAYIFGLCRLPTPAEMAFAASEHGHGLYLKEWDNDIAQRNLTSGVDKSGFEVGATIVKEKLMSGDAAFELVALGIMMKRAPGFDAAHGDWEFAYWDSLGWKRGAETSSYCGSCHLGAQGTDLVFVDGGWAGR